MTDTLYTLLQELARYLPNFLGAALILIIGVLLAKLAKVVVQRMVVSLQHSPLLSNTPLEMVMGETESVKRMAEMISGAVYWLLICLVLQHVFAALGLLGLSALFAQIVSYVPRVLKAVLVLLIALGLSGLVESMVKQMIRSCDVDVARMSGVVAGYVVMVVGVLAAVSELGIARDFIMVLFIGLVAALSLGVGLALGLGGQDAVRRLTLRLSEEWESKSTHAETAEPTVGEFFSSPETKAEAGNSKPRRRGGR